MSLTVGRPAPGEVAVTLHPRHSPGLEQAIAAIPGVRLSTPDDGDRVATSLSGAPVLVTFDWEDRFLSPALRWVQAISAGVDQFPIERLGESGVILTSARGAHTPAVAEHALALVMALLRRIGRAVDRSRRREWSLEMATELSGRMVTVLGFGSIGSEIGRVLTLLGANVIGVRRHPQPVDGAAQVVVAPQQLLWALERSSLLVVALPETEQTRSIVGSAELAALGPGWLVNLGRGTAVDEAALVAALVEGELKGAGLDVTATEPLPEESPLWTLDDVIITPHMAWATDRLNQRLVELFEKNLAAYRGESGWVNRIV